MRENPGQAGSHKLFNPQTGSVWFLKTLPTGTEEALRVFPSILSPLYRKSV